MTRFDFKFFYKDCNNCEHQKFSLAELGVKCRRTDCYCSSEFPRCYAENFKHWKPNKKAFRQFKKLRQKHPEEFL